MKNNYTKLLAVFFFFTAFIVFASEVFFLVTNSNRPEFYAEGEPQEMSSGLYSGYIHSQDTDYRKLKQRVAC